MDFIDVHVFLLGLYVLVLDATRLIITGVKAYQRIQREIQRQKPRKR